MSLIISRFEGQSLYIGDDIIVSHAGRHGRTVRIAVEAPREIPILREELYEPQGRVTMLVPKQLAAAVRKLINEAGRA